MRARNILDIYLNFLEDHRKRSENYVPLWTPQLIFIVNFKDFSDCLLLFGQMKVLVNCVEEGEVKGDRIGRSL